MSYRSIKRVLGETSLERKCRFLFGACLLLLITGSFWWYGSRTEQQVIAQNRRTGEGIVDYVILQRHAEIWADPKTAERLRLLWREVMDRRGGDDAQIGLPQRPLDAEPTEPADPATEQRIINSLARSLQNRNYAWDVIRPNTTDGQGKPQDAFEWEVLEKFKANRPPPAEGEAVPWEYDERLVASKNEYLYYQPIRWKSTYEETQNCRVCHTPRGADLAIGGAAIVDENQYLEGDLMAVMKVVIPYPDAETQKALNWNRALLLSTAILTVFVAMIALYIIVRYVIVKPLAHLREVSDAVSHGDLEQRADIHTGDEFEELGDSFNRMLRHLIEAQQELRQVNASLDYKVDELAQANMKLYEMNRLKSDFLATISHELRTPLNSILGFSDVLGSIRSLDDKQKRYVDNIRTSGKMLLDMINDILDLAKLESGKMDVRLGKMRIAQVIAAQCDMARPLTENKNIDLETDVEADLPPLEQDQAKVQQILNNLLSNAIKFTPEGGRIVVEACRGDRGDLLLTVSDTGVGIAEEDQVAVFEKFRQGKTVVGAGDAMTREYSGTGLGLSIVKELCKLLGGSISLESQLGRGSTFTVRLPWVLQQQPRLDSPLSDSLDSLTRPRLRTAGPHDPAAANHGDKDSGESGNGEDESRAIPRVPTAVDQGD